MRQLKLIARRLLTIVPMLFLVTLVIFSITYLIPGDPAATIAGENASPADVERIRDELGLNEPLVTQYFTWMGGVLRGDLGNSLHDGRSVTEVIGARAPATLSLTGASLLVAVVLGVPLGLAAATKLHSLRDKIAMIVASAGVAIPYYWLGLLLVTFLAVQLGWFPATGYVPLTENPLEWARHLVLPAIALGLAASAEIARQTRASVAGVLDLDYVRTARMKGLPKRTVMGKHVMKNAAGPVITTIGLRASVLLGGTVVVERVFGIPGLGGTALLAVSGRDIPVIQGIALLSALFAITVNLVVDLITSYLNPRAEIL